MIFHDYVCLPEGTVIFVSWRSPILTSNSGHIELLVRMVSLNGSNLPIIVAYNYPNCQRSPDGTICAAYNGLQLSQSSQNHPKIILKSTQLCNITRLYHLCGLHWLATISPIAFVFKQVELGQSSGGPRGMLATVVQMGASPEQMVGLGFITYTIAMITISILIALKIW